MKHVFMFFMILAINVVSTQKKKQINVATLIPLLQNHDGFCFKSAMRLAVDLINKDDRILKDYELVVDYKDSSTMIGFAFLRFYQMINTPPVKQVLVGPAFSATTRAIAKLATFYNIPQISYGSLANFEDEVMTEFTERRHRKIDRRMKTYPYYLRTTTSMNSFLSSKVKLFQHYGWKRIAILYEYSINEFFTAANALASLIQENGMELLSVQGFFNIYLDASVPMDKLQLEDARIIVGFLGSSGARKIFCEAYRRGMYGPKFQWVLFYGLPFDWYEEVRHIDTNNCTRSQYLQVSDRFITIARSPLRSDGRKTIANLTSAEIWEQIRAYKRQEWEHYWTIRNRTVPPIPESEYYVESTFAFDAMYLTALALNNSMAKKGVKTCSSMGSNIPLSECYKAQKDVSFGIVDSMLSTRFQGATGHLSFDPTTENRLGEVLIQQFRADENYTKGKFVNIGYYNDFQKEITLYEKSGLSVFHEQEIIKDGITIHLIPKTYSVTLTVFMFSLAGVGMLLSFFILGFNIHYRDVRLIKMSSPSINNGIITGCIISYLSVFAYGLDSRWLDEKNIPYACNAVVITLSIGFTLAFGCLFSKTWRIYKVFTAAKTMERVAIKDSHLFGVILILIGCDVIVFTLWMFISPVYMTYRHLDITEKNDVMNIYFYHQCSCNHQLSFTVAFYVYKGVLLLFGIFLAWETKHVKIAVLNDSKYIGMAIYNVCVVSTIGVVCTTALYNTENYTSSYLLVTLSVFFCTTNTLLIVFVPKMYLLFGKTTEKNYGSFYSRSVSSISSGSRISKTKSVSENRYSYSSDSTSFEKSPFSFYARDSCEYSPPKNVTFNINNNTRGNGSV